MTEEDEEAAECQDVEGEGGRGMSRVEERELKDVERTYTTGGEMKCLRVNR